MRLGDFIRSNRQQIILEWEQFARSLLPPGRTLDLEGLRDHAEALLLDIAQALATSETAEQQVARSKGKSDASAEAETPATSHGRHRGFTGFTIQNVVAEFRALRASVLRLWAAAENHFDRTNLEDVTRFNEAIDQALTESVSRYLLDLDKSKDLFLGILGHDLRNPLGAIMMSASTMIATNGASPHGRTFALILRSALRMEHIVRDLLDFTRSHLGNGIPISRIDMDLETSCRQIVDELAAFHPNRVLHFKATGQLHGRWDSDRIGQVVSNLLGNAIQHGWEDCPITVVLSGEADGVEIAVHNWGPVIPRDRRDEIFNPMKCVSPGATDAHDLASLGLGLYISKQIAVAHGGTIDVESSEQRGTTFTVRLPRARIAEPPHAQVH